MRDELDLSYLTHIAVFVLLVLCAIGTSFSQNPTAKDKVGSSATPSVEIETFDDATDFVLAKGNLAETVAAADNYAEAIKITQAAAAALKKSKFKDLKEYALALSKRYAAYQQVFDSAKPARDKLMQDPVDAKSNAVWGRYLCFYKGEWEDGLPMLARSDDAVWKALAEREADPANNSAALLKLGDDWLKASEKEADPIRFQIREHAYEVWLRATPGRADNANPGLSADLESRLEKWFGSIVAVAKGDAAGVPLPRSEELNPGQNFTLEFWVHTASNAGTLVSKHHQQSDQSLQLRLSPGKIHYEIAIGNGTGGTDSNLKISDGNWHHIAIVKKEDKVQYYIDGEVVPQSIDMVFAEKALNVARSFQSKSVWKLGCSRGQTGCRARFAGVRISNIARYARTFTPPWQYHPDAATRYLVQVGRDDSSVKPFAK